MPLERINPKQRTINQGIPATPTRQTPRTNRTIVENYSQLERVQFTPKNPPKTTITPPLNTQTQQDKDIEMQDNIGEQDEVEAGTSSSEEDHPNTPSKRCGIPSTITIKTRRKEKRARKPRSETTWTQYYFDVISLDETWVNEAKKGKLELINRQWTCKIYGPMFSSTDKERHGNTSKLNNHFHDAHHMDKQKHHLRVQPTGKDGVKLRAMDKFAVAIDLIPSAEEAVLQFFAMTNQPFELVEHKAFLNLYRSISTTCPIKSASTLRNREES